MYGSSTEDCLKDLEELAEKAKESKGERPKLLQLTKKHEQ